MWILLHLFHQHHNVSALLRNSWTSFFFKKKQTKTFTLKTSTLSLLLLMKFSTFPNKLFEVNSVPANAADVANGKVRKAAVPFCLSMSQRPLGSSLMSLLKDPSEWADSTKREREKLCVFFLLAASGSEVVSAQMLGSRPLVTSAATAAEGGRGRWVGEGPSVSCEKHPHCV